MDCWRKVTLAFLWPHALLLALCLLLSTDLSFAAPESNAPIESFGPCKDGAEFAAGLLAAVRKWTDYTVDSELWIYYPDKMTKSSCKLFYKDNQVRIQVIGGGFRDGSVIVRKKDGTVRAKGGGLLGLMAMNLDPNSRMLILPTGTNVVRTDLPDVFGEIETQLAAGYKSRVTVSAATTQDLPDKILIFDEYMPGGTELVRRIFCGGDKLPVRIDHFKAGKKITTAWFRNLSPNTGISDDLFRL